MTKDNILFSVIGLLLGVIVGYVFANTVNQRGYTPPRTSASSSAGPMSQSSELHGTRPEDSTNAAGSQGGNSSDDAAVLQQAQSQPDNFDAQMQAAAVQYRSEERRVGKECRSRWS